MARTLKEIALDLLKQYRISQSLIMHYDNENEYSNDNYELLAKQCDEIKRAIETAAAQEVKHGKWVFNPANGRNDCSECGIPEWGNWQYCPHCGAKMNGR